MYKQSVCSTLVFWVAVQTLAISLGAGPARGQSSSANYTLLVASGFLCDSAACPAVTKSEAGDTWEISGAGALNTQNKSVTVAGAFAHKSSNGTVLVTGVWIGSALVSCARACIESCERARP
jgi:hypothetical protein